MLMCIKVMCTKKHEHTMRIKTMRHSVTNFNIFPIGKNARKDRQKLLECMLRCFQGFFNKI